MLLWRLPQEKAPTGRSRCIHCDRVLSWYELVPVLSFIFLRGRCSSCHARIPLRYLFVEIICGLVFGLFGLLLWSNAAPLASITTGVIVLVMTSLLLFDLYYFLLPDVFTYTGILIAIISIFIRHLPYLPYIVAALILGSFFAILYAWSRGKWLGFGDVKLAILIGLVFGLPMAIWATLGGIWLGALIGLAMMAGGKASMKKALPFGTFLCCISLILLLFHDRFIFLETFFQ